MNIWLNIIGVGDDGLDYLHPDAARALADATLIIGGQRHIDMLPENDSRPKMIWPSPLMKLVDDVLQRRGETIVILATGDPMQYGIGVTFAKRLPKSEFAVFPALSAFSLAAARLGWDLSRTTTLTLHGRPLELLLPHLRPNARLMALSDNGNTPAEVADLLCREGYEDSVLTVLEHMGGLQEQIKALRAKDWAGQVCKELNTIAIDCVASTGTQPVPSSPGLADDAFIHDGQLTKKEIRSTTLAALTPINGQLLWDVGAGSGSIGIEWMRLCVLNQAIAIEDKKDRLEFIEQNRRRLGVPGLKIAAGTAPNALEDLPAPDRIFIGGGITGDGVFDTCWHHLKPGGVLVANTVTTQGESLAFNLAERYDGDLTRLDFARAVKIGNFTSWKPFRQVTQLRLVKK